MRRRPIAILRKAIGITQAELARQLGVTRSHINRAEKQGSNLHAKRLLKLRDMYPWQMRKCGLKLEDLILATTGYTLGSAFKKHAKRN